MKLLKFEYTPLNLSLWYTLNETVETWIYSTTFELMIHECFETVAGSGNSNNWKTNGIIIILSYRWT